MISALLQTTVHFALGISLTVQNFVFFVLEIVDAFFFAKIDLIGIVDEISAANWESEVQVHAMQSAALVVIASQRVLRTLYNRYLLLVV
ncbi:MAG: hypothetical protein DHS20C13_28760 [Thermodesulfobacteriota bacterium]|nr:MAG: hypothetical protein DHS20C13_28760 [Thermodesulfobacteriota bacterium]